MMLIKPSNYVVEEPVSNKCSWPASKVVQKSSFCSHTLFSPKPNLRLSTTTKLFGLIVIHFSPMANLLVLSHQIHYFSEGRCAEIFYNEKYSPTVHFSFFLCERSRIFLPFIVIAQLHLCAAFWRKMQPSSGNI